MSMAHNRFRHLRIATMSLFALILLVSCANEAFSVNNLNSREESGEQSIENLLENIDDPLVEVPHEKENKFENSFNDSHLKESVEIHDLDFSGGGHEVREFENNNMDEISLQSSSVPDPIVTPDLCYYTAKRNVNCRVSDYVESSLIAILMHGEEAKLLYLNPIFTHGKFELLNNSQCWIALGLLHGPSDPYKTCKVSVVDAPPSKENSDLGGGNSLDCSPDLDKDACEAAGGVWGAVSAYCDCG